MRTLDHVLGGRIDRRFAGILAAIGTNFAGLAVFSMYFGPWLIRERHASTLAVSVAFLVAGMAGAAGGYLGGRISDRYGRRRVIVGGGIVQVAAAALLLLPLGTTVACLLLVVVTAAQPLRGVAQRALLADMSDPEAREKTFADYRLVLSLGLFGGPLLGALLVARDWRFMHVGVLGLFAASLALSLTLPTDRPAAAAAPAPRPSLLGDRRLHLLLFASTAAWTVVYAYETVLPTTLIGTGRMEPATWGLIYALGPALVILFQLRIQRWFSFLPASGRLLTGMLLMGGAFGVLVVDVSVGTVVVFAVLFLCGDMIWGPASEDVAVAAAPVEHRGAYLGVMATSIWLGSALAPGLGLPLREAFGDGVLWTSVGVLAAVGAAAYLVAGRVRTGVAPMPVAAGSAS